jgi:hypothetical protein
VSQLTFDSGFVTFDSSFITWDGSGFAGVVFLVLDNATVVEVPLANVRTESFSYDRRMFRSPYGTVWHLEGDDRRLVENITVDVFVIDDANGISDAAIQANALTSVLPNVVRVVGAIGAFDVVALESFTRQPVQSGYRLSIIFVVDTGL